MLSISLSFNVMDRLMQQERFDIHFTFNGKLAADFIRGLIFVPAFMQSQRCRNYDARVKNKLICNYRYKS